MRSTDTIRNVVLVGHNAGGKTSLAEALLVAAGVIGYLKEKKVTVTNGIKIIG